MFDKGNIKKQSRTLKHIKCSLTTTYNNEVQDLPLVSQVLWPQVVLINFEFLNCSNHHFEMLEHPFLLLLSLHYPHNQPWFHVTMQKKPIPFYLLNTRESHTQTILMIMTTIYVKNNIVSNICGKHMRILLYMPKEIIQPYLQNRKIPPCTTRQATSFDTSKIPSSIFWYIFPAVLIKACIA